MTGRVLSAMIFGGVALIVTGFAVSLWFEALAIWTGKESTISQLSAGAIQNHPHVALLCGILFGIIVGALATHFTRWSST